MCGRFAFFSPAEALIATFGVAPAVDCRPRYNIAPSQDVLVVRHLGSQLIADRLRWGLVPFWAKDPAIGNRLINARAETLAEKPSFRQALRRRRCLIPADGFFEWQPGAAGKQPWYISAADNQVLAFAGLWEEWQTPERDVLSTCTIITTAANAFMQPLHSRMPVLLSRDYFADWLNTGASAEVLNRLLHGLPDIELRAHRVSRAVNSPLNDGPELLEAAAAP